MAGYWPSSFFFCVFMDRGGVVVRELAITKGADIQSYYTTQALRGPITKIN